ncbi:MAG: hypothetical protein ACI85O_000788 [Saprospiraceae bacterium]|jgi:hypothetical protein
MTAKKITKYCLIIFIGVFTSYISNAQSLEILWDVTYDDIEGTQDFSDFVILNNNQIALAGTDADGTGNYGLLILADAKTGEKIKHQSYGYPRKTRFNALTAAPDGSIYLVGTSQDGKNTKGYLVRTDQEGNQIAESEKGDKGQNSYEDIAWLLPENRGVIVGYKGKQNNGDVWLLRVEGNEPVGEIVTNNGGFQDVKGVESAGNSSAWIYGNTRKSKDFKKGQIWYAKTNEKLSLNFPNTIKDKEWKSVLSSNVTADGGLLMGGEIYALNSGVKDPWLAEITPLGNEKRSQPISLENNNHVVATVKSPYDDVFMIVESEFNRYNTNTYPLRLFWQSDVDVKEYNLPLGGTLFQIKKLLRRSDDTFIIAGTALSPDNGKPKAMRVACFTIEDYNSAVKARNTLISPSDASKPAFDVSEITLFDENKDGKLSPGERGSLRFRLVNKSADYIKNARIRTRFIKSISGLNTEKVPLETGFVAAGGDNYYHLPIICASYSEAGIATMKITVQPQNRKLAGLVFEAKIECTDNPIK